MAASAGSSGRPTDHGIFARGGGNHRAPLGVIIERHAVRAAPR